jgi:hypothetical protein
MSTRVRQATVCTLIVLAAFFLCAAAGAEGESPEAPEVWARIGRDVVFASIHP